MLFCWIEVTQIRKLVCCANTSSKNQTRSMMSLEIIQCRRFHLTSFQFLFSRSLFQLSASPGTRIVLYKLVIFWARCRLKPIAHIMIMVSGSFNRNFHLFSVFSWFSPHVLLAVSYAYIPIIDIILYKLGPPRFYSLLFYLVTDNVNGTIIWFTTGWIVSC